MRQQDGTAKNCCGTCEFFLQLAEAGEWGGCRRFPPGWDRQLSMSEYRPVHPKTPACGEFRLSRAVASVAATLIPPARGEAKLAS